jgi:serine/threonine protein kinase
MEANAKAELKEYEQMVTNKTKEVGSCSINDFVMLQVIGKGSYGKVILVKKKDTQKHYALKILKKEEIMRKKQYDHTMAERSILGNVDYPFIVKMDYAF